MPAIRLEGVSKKFRFYQSQRERLKEALSFGKGKYGRDFWALQDIDLEVEPGTTLGILGRNGAGKSTLLRIISGILQPTSGTAERHGRLIALFGVGAGFNPDFTGRENVMLNGLLLGLQRKEMLERFDEIEAFADIGDFIEQPVKTYSSGMRSRLGFAVAVNVAPDILVVDETLSVGDAVFKAMGIQKMHELRDSGTTILFVSHSASLVKNFCTEGILLNKGRLVYRGDTSDTIDQYQSLISEAAARRNDRHASDEQQVSEMMQDEEDPAVASGSGQNSAIDVKSSNLRHGTGEAKIERTELLDERGDTPTDAVAPESKITVRLHVRYAEDVEGSVVGISVRNRTGLDIFSTNTNLEKTRIKKRVAGERVVVDFTFQVPLKHGDYSVVATVSDNGEDTYMDWVGVATVFKVARPSGRGAFAGLVQLPTQVRLLEPDRASKGDLPD
jgi:ABC-2 type transport system ATP-binding protein